MAWASRHDAVRALTREHEHALEELLDTDREVNLFLLGMLAQVPIERCHWYGLLDGDRVRATALLLPGRLCVPFAPDAEDASLLARHLARREAPCMTVGPREAVDRVWEEWGRARAPRRVFDQRLYVLREPPACGPDLRVRRARHEDWPVVARYAVLMQLEDLGTDPSAEDPRAHDRVVQDRIAAGRTWVVEDEGEIVYQINTGTSLPWGCQVGGTYVPVPHRRRGWGTLGTAEVCGRLMKVHPLVTLHVNEANTPAVRAYERVGFQRSAPFRLVTV